MCRFDRNEFGQFLGSATVVYDEPADAKKAIEEYNGASLDDKILTVEFVAPIVVAPKIEKANRIGKGKTLNLKRR